MADDKKPNLDELQFYAERLANIISYIEQFKAAVDFLVHQRNDLNDMAAEVPKMKAERDQAQAERDGMIAEAEKAKADHAAALEGINAQAQKTQADLAAQLAEQKQKLEDAEAAHKIRMAEMAQEYDERLGFLKSEIEKNEDRLHTITEGIQAHRTRWRACNIPAPEWRFTITATAAASATCNALTSSASTATSGFAYAAWPRTRRQSFAADALSNARIARGVCSAKRTIT